MYKMNKADTLLFINQNPVFSLATCEINIPHVRHMLVIKADTIGIFFNVKAYKPVYQQLIANPNVELCFYNATKGTQLRLEGEVIEILDEVMVDKLLIQHPDAQNQVSKYGKDVIRLFSLQDWQATFWNNQNKEATVEIEVVFPLMF